MAMITATVIKNKIKKGKTIMTKKRITKRVVALAAAAMMLVGMVIPASAAPQGSITVHKYAGNRASTLENYTGEELSAADVSSKITAAGYTPLAGAKFQLYQATPAQITALRNSMSTTPALKVVGHTIDTTGATPKIVFEMSAGGDVSVDTAVYGSEGTTNAAGEAVLGSTIPNGYYVLVETEVPADHSGAEPSLIQLPLTGSDGKQNYDVHVYPKNISTTNLVKKDMGDVPKPVENGDILDFDLKLKFKNTETNPAFKVDSAQDLVHTNGTSFGIARITEIFSTDFEYQASSLKAYWLKTDGTIDTTRELTAAQWATIGTLPTTAGGQIVAELTQAGLTAAKTEEEVGFGIVLKAKYVGHPVAGTTDHKIVNKMEGFLRPANGTNPTPTNPPAGTPTPTPVIDETFAPTLSVKVNKTKEDGSTALAGVTFAIATVPVPSIDYDPAVSYAAGELATAGYVVNAAGTPITATTNAAGEVFFSNLEGYADGTGAKFYLKEVATAPNYQLKINTIEVTFSNKAGYQSSNATWFNGANWKQGVDILATANVVNYPFGTPDPDELGFSLPLTGGAGTVMFTVAGIAVMLAAATLIIKGKKKEA